MDRANTRAGSSSARDDNSRIVRHVSHLAQVRETSQDSPVTQKRADPSSCEMDPSSCSKTRVTPSLSPRECPSLSCHFGRRAAIATRCICSLCMVLRLALLFACTPLSARNAFTMIFTSSADPPETLCSSRSMAVGCARPYLRSASVCPSASRTSNRFSGDTMFSVILLMSALYVLSSLQNRTSSQIWFGRRGSSLAQYVDKPCAFTSCRPCCPSAEET